MKKFVDQLKVQQAAQMLKNGVLGASISTGKISIGVAPWWRPITNDDVLVLRVAHENAGHGAISTRQMNAAIRLAEGHAPAEIWKVKRHADGST